MAKKQAKTRTTTRAKPRLVPSRPRRKLPQRTKRAPKQAPVRASPAPQSEPGEGRPRIAPWLCARRSPTRDARAYLRLGPKLTADWSVDLGAGAAGAPVVSNDGVLYVGDREGTLHALDVESGEVRWTRRTDPIREVSPVWPLVEQGLVPAQRVPISATAAILRWHLFVGDDEGIFYGLRRGEAVAIWRKAAPLELSSRSGGAYQAPFAVGDMVYTADAEGNLYAAWTRSGKTAFSRFLRGRPAAPPALGQGGQLILITTRPLYPGEPARLHALSALSGDRRWTAPLLGQPGSALATARHHALVGTQAGLSAYRLDDGSRAWHQPLAAGVGGPLALDAQRIYTTSGGAVHAFALDGGAPLWTRPTGADGLAPLAIGAGLTLGGDVLWVPAERSLIALDPETGRVLARQRIPGVPVGEPVLAADRLLVATDTGALRAFR